MNTNVLSREKKNILELAYLEEGRIRLSLSESQGPGPITFYQETEIAIEKIDGLVQEINRYLNKINVLKNPNQRLLAELQKSCQMLYHELLSREIKERLQNTSLKNLELILDEQLVHIPWELLFDGQKFLCEQFSMGRKVRTKGSKIIQHSTGQPKAQLNMLIIADPTEDLEIAWREGIKIYEEFQKKENLVKITLQTSDQVDLDFVKKNLWDYDLVHYAGHADYDPAKPDKSGWMLADGKLEAADILKMAGGKRAMPGLVFGNACQSGYTNKWSKEKSDQTQAGYGLVYAFLMAGVHYYLGTFCDVSDEYGAYMGIEFYNQLLEGNTIGESLRRARGSFREKYGQKSFTWINYVLYGHPGDYLICPDKINTSQSNKSQSKEASKISADLSLEPEPEAPVLRRLPFSFPPRDRWMGTSIVFLLLLIFVTLVIFFPRERMRDGPVQENQRQTILDRKQERIEELKKMIYQKLKIREERAPSLKPPVVPFDKWTSKPVVIAIFTIFDDEKEPLPGWVGGIIKDVGGKLTQHFVEDARIRVAERKELDKLLEEKDLELSDFSLKDQRDIFAEFLYAGVMLFLKGYKASDGLSLCYKVVDTKTGEIDKIDSGIKLSKKANPNNLAQLIFPQAQQVIYAKNPLRAKITEVQDNLVVLNIGAEVGIRKGDIFEVFASDDREIKNISIGRIRAARVTVDPAGTQCEILKGNEFSKGMRVEIAAK